MNVPSMGRVLVVEPARELTASGLGAAGFEVRSVAKELAALALAAKEPFDVVIVDASLPGMDGMSLVARLRERAPGTAVVLLMNEHTNQLAAEAAEAGVFQMLQKPTDLRSLERVVLAAVSQTRHLLSTFRAIVHPANPPRSVPATDAKNEFGSIFAKHEPDLHALSREFDDLVARMRTPKARAAARDLFTATSKQFGEAAVAGVKPRDG